LIQDQENRFYGYEWIVLVAMFKIAFNF